MLLTWVPKQNVRAWPGISTILSRSRALDLLRMVEIPGHALTFCFGTHVRSTGEIGRLAGMELTEGKKRRKSVSFQLE